MSLLARSLLIGGLLLAAYYALIFGYALRTRAERREHVAWRFPLAANSDLCADPLDNGGVVCSDSGRVIVVGPSGAETASYTAYDLPYADDYGYYQPAPFNGYQWIGGTKDSLTFVSVAKPPMGQLRLVAMESDGEIRWEHEVEPELITGWITCSPDSVFVLYHKDQRPNATCVIQRMDLTGKLLFSTELQASAAHIAVRDDNRLYLLDSASNSIRVLDPKGKELWAAMDAVSMPLRPNFANGGLLYYLDKSHILHAVGEDGKQRFTASLPGQGVPYVGNDFWWREIFGGSSRTGSAYRLNARSLDKGRVADSEGVVFVLRYNSLVGVGSSGNVLWQTELPNEPLSLAADRDGNAYVALTSGGLAAYHRSGKEKWRNTSIRNFSSLISIGSQGQIYVEADKQLICFTP